MKTVEVYKTDVEDPSEADSILDEIRRELPDSEPSFDLDDCDKVLRVEQQGQKVNGEKLGRILDRHGYQIEPLP